MGPRLEMMCLVLLGQHVQGKLIPSGDVPFSLVGNCKCGTAKRGERESMGEGTVSEQERGI